MIFFYSSPAAKQMRTQSLIDCGIRNFLLSFAVDAKKIKDFQIAGSSIIIDSGAFSAWQSGKKIDINEYLCFCKSLPDSYVFVNLDVIPETGSSASARECACQQSFENFLFLSKNLKRVLPVYHYGDEMCWLEKYIERTNYVGISPANDIADELKKLFLDRVFAFLPLQVRTHAFGYSSVPGLFKYPFYSVDSTSYNSVERFGNMNIYVNRSMRTVPLEEYAYRVGMEYTKGKQPSPELLIKAYIEIFESMIRMENDVNDFQRTSDFSFLKNQTTLF